MQHRHADDIHPYGRADGQSYGTADGGTDDVDPYGLADFHALSCADVDAHAGADAHVRACFACAASCTLPAHGLHAQACMLTHAHHGTCPRSRAQSWAPPSMTLRCTHLRRDRAGTASAPMLVHIRAGTDAQSALATRGRECASDRPT